MITAEDLEAMGYDYYTPEDLPKPPKTVYGMVKEFQNITGQNPTFNLYQTLVNEELVEYAQALLAWNKNISSSEALAEVVKEASDLIYVLYGMFDTLGINLDESIRKVHENNVGRCIQPDGSVKRREDGKIEKNPNYPKLSAADLIGNLEKYKEIMLRLAKA